MRVLLTGGAGYVGSHTAQAMAQAGHEITVLDDLSHGHRQAVGDFPFFQVDITDRAAVRGALAGGGFDAVMHFAALILVGESVREPARYHRVNVTGSLHLLDAMAAAGCRRMIFSSSAAVYGIPRNTPILEEHPTEPINPYGQNKLDVERALERCASEGDIGSISLRYFNAAGASSDGRLGEDHNPEEHLIPLVLRVALGQAERVAIFGTDYDTPDGTCIRDFIHVEDLAAVHVLALEAVQPGRAVAYNVGTGQGHSVQQVISAARAVTGHPLPVREAPPRPGDVPTLVAAADAIRRDLGWRPRSSDLTAILASAWSWHRRHPHGYQEEKGDGSLFLPQSVPS